MSKHELEIESALESSDEVFSRKYQLMKERLLNVEYEHVARGFPEGNNHGRGHVTRVLENLNLLLGCKPSEHLNGYELFLTMMAVLYHDIGMLRARAGHAETAKTLLEEDTHDAYIIDPLDKEIIASAVACHSGTVDMVEEFRRFSQVERIKGYDVRPRVVGALVQLADQLDEDCRRADAILEQRFTLPEESKFFWRFCQRVRGVRPDLVAKRIDFNLALEPEDTTTYGPVPGGKKRHFVAFVAEKLADINQGRVAVNRFLPDDLTYSGIHVEVKPLRGHPEWKDSRTFVFNERTTAKMFLDSFPELLAEPARSRLQAVLEYLRERKLDEADAELQKLATVEDDLPRDVQTQIYYELACIAAMRAASSPIGDPRRDAALDAAVTHLARWCTRGCP